MLVQFYEYGRTGDPNPIRAFLDTKEGTDVQLIDPITDSVEHIRLKLSCDETETYDKLGLPATYEDFKNLRDQVKNSRLELFDILLSTIPFEWTYRAGCLSFSHLEDPNQIEQNSIMDSFEDFSAAGITSDIQFHWVRSRKNGRLVLSFASPRMHFGTGKSFNMAPPGYQKSYDVWRDYINATYFSDNYPSICKIQARTELDAVITTRKKYNQERMGVENVELFSGT